MPARNQQHQIGKGQPVGQARGQGMTGKMIDPDKGQAGRRRKPLGAHDTGQNPADQARPSGDGDGRQIRQPDLRLCQCLGGAEVNLLGMGPCRDFGDNAAKVLVQRGLAEDDRRQDVRLAVRQPDNRCGGVVATAFQPKNGDRRGHVGFGCAGVSRQVTPMARPYNPGGWQMTDTSDLPTLLLTRPARQSERFASEFRARFGADWPVVISPLSRLDLLSPQIELQGVAGLIFTSETGVAGFARLNGRRDLPVFCVGPRTAAAARAAGFDAKDGPGDATGLTQLILASGHRGPLLYVRGQHVASDLAEILNPARIVTKSCIVYDQSDLPLSAAAGAVLQSGAPVLLAAFSPRGGSALARAVPPGHGPLLLAAISPAAMKAATALGATASATAPTPDADGMIAALGRLIAAFRQGDRIGT